MKFKTLFPFFLFASLFIFWACSSDDDASLPSETNTPPTITITSPADGASFAVGEIVTISVDVNDEDNNLQEVRFYVNGIGASSVDSFPYNFEWNTAGENTGNFVIKAEALDEDNEIAFDEINLVLGSGLVVDFEADITTASVGEPINFTNLSTSNVGSTWSWDFGDGNLSSDENPSHSYENPGIYTVELSVSDGANQATETKIDYITVESPINYFPLVVENEWQYENTQSDSGEVLVSLETLTVDDEEEVENVQVFTLNSTDNETPVSFTSILANGEVYKSGNQLLLTGSFDLGIDQAELPELDIDFEDLVVYDSQASAGNIMFTDERDVELPEFNNITLSLTLSIESISLGSFDNLEVDSDVYNDVIGSQFIVSIGIDATTTIAPLPIPITIEVLEFQEVINSSNYFANGVGLVESETNLSVVFSDELNQIPNFDLEDIMVVIEQKLQDYQVTLED